jgi:transcriptional regulator with XRE-family HTH domain
MPANNGQEILLLRNFHKNVAKLRADNGMTVADASRRVGVSAPSWYKYEAGTQFPGPATIDRIAAVFHVRSHVLFRQLADEGKEGT